MSETVTKEVSKATKKRRFNTLLDYLTELNEKEPERFNLSAWMTTYKDKNLIEAVTTWVDRYQKGDPLNCGTTACLVGHMPVIFPRAFSWVAPGHFFGATSFDTDDLDASVSYHPNGLAKVRSNWFEAQWTEDFFGGGVDIWRQIIFGTNYPEDAIGVHGITLDAVLKRLEKLYEKLYE